MTFSIDLIYVEYDNEKTLSCVVVDGLVAEQIGPVPIKAAIELLAPDLLRTVPERFADLKAVTTLLTLVHFRNMGRGANDAGQSYPFRLPGKAPTEVKHGHAA